MSPRPGGANLAAPLPHQGNRMAKHLYRLGGWAFAHGRRVLVAWLAILTAVIACRPSWRCSATTRGGCPHGCGA